MLWRVPSVFTSTYECRKVYILSFNILKWFCWCNNRQKGFNPHIQHDIKVQDASFLIYQLVSPWLESVCSWNSWSDSIYVWFWSTQTGWCHLSWSHPGRWKHASDSSDCKFHGQKPSDLRTAAGRRTVVLLSRKNVTRRACAAHSPWNVTTTGRVEIWQLHRGSF